MSNHTTPDLSTTEGFAAQLARELAPAHPNTQRAVERLITDLDSVPESDEECERWDGMS